MEAAVVAVWAGGGVVGGDLFLLDRGDGGVEYVADNWATDEMARSVDQRRGVGERPFRRAQSRAFYRVRGVGISRRAGV